MLLDKDQSNKTPDDQTPITGAATDVSPLGREGAKPRHEQTADEDAEVVNWNQIAESESFKRLVKAKLKFIVPATVLFIVYYFALPVLVGYAPELMNRKVIGSINIAYLFALSQFFMAWAIALVYMRAASRHDRMARQVIEESGEKQGGE